MPGIVGVISWRPPAQCQNIVQAMLTTLEHEQFYTSNTYEAPKLGGYAGWVAHKDSFAAQQVFLSLQQDIALVISGECFLDAETRSRPVGEERCSAGKKSDQLISSYEEQGDLFFEKLNGLFSGVLIDKRVGKIFLFNDRYRMERIYWHKTDDAFYFASEAKALLRVLPQLRQFDTEGVAEFLSFGCTLGSRTLFRGIETLPAASLWCFEGLQCHKRKYFFPQIWESQPLLSPEAFKERFEQRFQKIIASYSDDNTPVGISLTAGLDSRMIMACLPENIPTALCHTFSGETKDTLDARIAARVAAACGLEHHILRLDRDFLEEFALYADQTVYVTDGTLGVMGAHEIYFNRQARQLAPVRLTGVFGGEIMRGVSFFKPLQLSSNLVNPEMLQSIKAIEQEQFMNRQHPVTFAAFTETAQNRFGGVAASRSQLPFRTPYLDNAFVSLAFQVPASLRGAADPALWLIKRNRPQLAKIPTDRGRLGQSGMSAHFLRRLFCEASFKLDYYASEGLPRHLNRFDSILRGLTSAAGLAGMHKFLLYRRWFQRELAEHVSAMLSRVEGAGSQFWNHNFVARMMIRHKRERQNYTREVNAVLTLEAVDRLLFQGLSRLGEDQSGLGLSASGASPGNGREVVGGSKGAAAALRDK